MLFKSNTVPGHVRSLLCRENLIILDTSTCPGATNIQRNFSYSSMYKYSHVKTECAAHSCVGGRTVPSVLPSKPPSNEAVTQLPSVSTSHTRTTLTPSQTKLGLIPPSASSYTRPALCPWERAGKGLGVPGAGVWETFSSLLLSSGPFRTLFGVYLSHLVITTRWAGQRLY